MKHGFTLIEILVALVLIGLLAGTLMPAVINQLNRGETNRITEDLAALERGAKAFRTDVSRWPGGLDDLVSAPTTADRDIEGNAFPTGLAGRWAGPYLEIGTIPGDTLISGGGAIIDSVFTSLAWGSANFVVMKAIGVSADDTREISVIVDGDTATTGGKVRWKAGGTGLPDTLVYYATPIE